MTGTAPRKNNTATINWQDIDTVFLDMDGTILDLSYDNWVWNEMVPRAYAETNDLPLDRARDQLLSHMREIYGTIQFYSFEYWTDFTGIDLVALHSESAHMIEYRPGALEFLRWLRKEGKQAVIATNAHRSSVTIKERAIAIEQEVDVVVSSQDFGAPKEDLAFWHQMQNVAPYDPARSFFADDNEPVLESARNAGIAHLWTIVTPDSQMPSRGPMAYPQFDDFREIF